LAAPANAASETGKVVAVIQSASAAHSDGSRRLEAGMPVFVGERIDTDRAGQVQFLFTDGTKLVVGPRSSLVIEAYLLRSQNTVERLRATALGGTFRFITGRSPKQAYSFKTPAAAITVRGTSFDLTVRRNRDDLLLYSGELEFCDARGCVLVTESCSLATARRNADVRLETSRERRNLEIRASFPYAMSQVRLRSDFRVSTRGCGDIIGPQPALRQGSEGESEPREREPEEPEEPEEPDAPEGPDIN
jgi:hypothetical protein